MTTAVLDNTRVSKHLGQTSEYKDQYDPTLLVREPRINNRTHLDIQDDDLPFEGYDIWNAYEVSGLTRTGLPVAGIAKIVYPCNSEYIVESKSIKLYFNSFNMYKCGGDSDDVLSSIAHAAEKDLSTLLETHVSINIEKASGRANRDTLFRGECYHTLEDMITSEEIMGMTVDTYNETPELLLSNMYETDDSTVDRYHSSLLKSNCRVTSQPDWGDVFIYMDSKKHISPINLLKYIISFRDECHFHEEICETIYKRIYDYFSPAGLAVTCLYARRGGIDINPVRASDKSLISKELIDHHIMHAKTPKQ
jgi:7-cyano-7-deazaguanine reductase